MSFEDLIRVADLKTRKSRFERVRKDVIAKPDEPIHIIEFLKPGLDEICGMLPPGASKRVHTWAVKNGWEHKLSVGMHISPFCARRRAASCALSPCSTSTARAAATALVSMTDGSPIAPGLPVFAGSTACGDPLFMAMPCVWMPGAPVHAMGDRAVPEDCAPGVLRLGPTGTLLGVARRTSRQR